MDIQFVTIETRDSQTESNLLQSAKINGIDIEVLGKGVEWKWFITKFEILDKYLEECSRVLKKGGVGCIYFGRKSVISEGRSEKSLYFLDRFFELFLRKGYLEIESRVNEKNLVLSLSKVRGVLKKHGFIVKNINISRKKIIGQEKKLGGQYGAVFQKI